MDYTKTDLETITKIINCNYAVINTRDDYDCGYVARYESKDEAYLIKAGNRYGGYLKGCIVRNELAIVGEVDFNGGSAYIFNYKFPQTSHKTQGITAGFFDDLKDCYSFGSTFISSIDLPILVKEYHERGGFKFKNYYDYENLILKPLRISEENEFISEIVSNIQKHEYKNTSDLTWGNGYIEIKQVDRNCVSLNKAKSVMDLDLPLKYKIEINSIFGIYCKEVNLLNDGTLSIPCQDKTNRHKFVVFTVNFKK